MDTIVELKDWSLGVIVANEPDIIPNNSSPKAWNSAFRSMGQGQAVIGVRPGHTLVNETALSGSPIIHRLYPYAYDSSGTISNYVAIFGNDGKLYFKTSSDTITAELTPPANFPYTASKCFASGDFLVDCAVMNNRLFALNTNGEKRSLLNQTFKAFGLSPIATIAVTAQAGGSSAMPLEAYGVAVTSYDSATLAESSRSAITAVTTAGANDRIRVVITPTAGETAQYSHWRVYLRRDATQANPLKVLVLEDIGGASITTDGNIPIATTTVYVDLTAAQIAALVVLSPSDTENNPLPTSARYVAVFGRRLLAADTRNLYWSKIDKPDAFPPGNTEIIDTGEGDQIKGLAVLNEDVAVIFTTSAMFGVFGNDPQSWTIAPIDTSVGCASHMSVVNANKRLYWWSDSYGPVVWSGANIELIGLEKLGQQIIIDDVEPTKLDHISAGFDPQGFRIECALPTVGVTTRNDFRLPFNLRMNAWESSRWDGIDVASHAIGVDASGNRRLFVGGYAGQIFKVNQSVLNDGTPSGTKSGTFVATSDTMGTITSSGFYTTGAGLVERKVTITTNDDRPLFRLRISSNTATVLTLASNMTQLQIGTTYKFYVGAPDFRFYTKWIDHGLPFLMKRMDELYIQAKSASESADVFVATQIEFAESDTDPDLAQNVGGSLWDDADATWDASFWGGSDYIKKRLSLHRWATALRVAVLKYDADEDFILNKISILARVLSDRTYA